MNEGCPLCGADVQLVVRLDADTTMCSACYKKHGQPDWRGDLPTAEEMNALETAARKQMLKHGGDRRYQVLSGRT